MTNNIDKIWFGGDYNPEQWSFDDFKQDVELLLEAGVNVVTLGVFSWAYYQKDEDTYNFDFLLRYMDYLYQKDIDVCLGTGTTSQPAWMSKKYSNLLPVDKEGKTLSYGSRQSYCPNSSVYKKYSEKLVFNLVNIIKGHKALKMWHINNEYAAHNPSCYCENCEIEFRKWLQNKYKTIDSLNSAWNTSFWGQLYYNFNEIIPPRLSTYSNNPSQEIDYKRFYSDSILDCFLSERKILKEITPEIPVTTNFMGWFLPLDYFKWAKFIDVISFDSYPEISKNYSPELPAFNYDLMRCLKSEKDERTNRYCGKSFLLMEQASNNTNWRHVNPNKRPGVMENQTWQAIARGSSSAMFFQCKQSISGSEMYHSAIIPASGKSDGRVYNEVKELGIKIKNFSDIVNTKIFSDVAVMFDWDNWWALENSNIPSKYLSYYNNIMVWYKSIFKINVSCDIIPFDSDLEKMSSYKIIIAPLMHMIKPGMDLRIARYIENGGIFLTTFFSGMIDETGALYKGGYMNSLKEIFGIEVEEFDTLDSNMANSFGNDINEYNCSTWCDVIKTVTAETLYKYKRDYYKNMPAVTVNRYFSGLAYYIATFPDEKFIDEFLKNIFDKRVEYFESNDLAYPNMEICSRESENSKYTFQIDYVNNITKINKKICNNT